MNPKEPRVSWCVDCFRFVAEPDWWQHSLHLMREASPKGARSAAPVGEQLNESRKSVRRYLSGVDGWDQCLGGGIMQGTRILFTGEPGCGKSTLLLLVLWMLARSGLKVVYITGEESREEINQRFENMHLPKEDRLILHSTKSWEAAMVTIRAEKPHVVALDSLQELKVASIDAPAGDARQVAKLMELTAMAVENEARHPAFVIIGHINSRGLAYGAMATMHKITTHLHFKKNPDGRRLLHTGKNRQGASGEVAMFEFPANGQLIREVPDISKVLMQDSKDRPGVVAYPTVPSDELSRRLCVPIEAFVSPPKGPSEQRVRKSVGLPDHAIEDALDRLGDCDIKLSDRTVRLFAPRIGDLVVVDDGAQLTTAIALVASLEKLRLPNVGAFGALGPSGNILPDPDGEARLVTLSRAGIVETFGPRLNDVRIPPGMDYHAVDSLHDIVETVKARAAFQRVQDVRASGAVEATTRESPSS